MALPWLPWKLRTAIDSRRRRSALVRAVADLRRLPSPASPPPSVLERLAYGWGNEEWSPRVVFLERIVGVARRTGGPILECGAGLSTVLLGLIAPFLSLTIWSLEEDPAWARKVQATLSRHEIRGVQLVQAPLQPFGEYSWYGVPQGVLPDRFSLVICDGPSGKTPGGRFGLVPQLRDHLAPGCVILLDDVSRPAERETMERWGRMIQAEPTVISPGGAWGRYAYGVLTVPGAAPTPVEAGVPDLAASAAGSRPAPRPTV